MAETDYYKILGVAKGASAEIIKKSYRELARKNHPDKVAELDPELQTLAARKMEAINEAYTVLSDPDKRKAYDNGTLRGSSTFKDKAEKPKPRSQRGSGSDGGRASGRSGSSSQEVLKDHAHSKMMIETSMFQLRDRLKSEVELGWTDLRERGFLAGLAAKTFTKRYYVYFKVIYTLSPNDFLAFLQRARALDKENKGGFGGKETLFIIAFSSMENGVKVESLWRQVNDESLKSGKSRKYIAMVNTSTSKTFPPPVKIKDKTMRKIADNVRYKR